MGKPKPKRPTEPVKQAVVAIGGPNEVRQHFKLRTVHAIYKWMRTGIPSTRVRDFHRLALDHGHQVSLEQLRPDLYGDVP